MSAVQHMLRDLLPVLAPQVVAGPIQPPPPPPPPPIDDTIAALMLCGFNEMAATALKQNGMNSIDNMSVMDTANFTSMGSQVSHYCDPHYGGATPVLPIPAMNGLKGMFMWAAYHKARDSDATMRDFTQDIHDAFLA
jgi:hypothetical protein